MDRINCSRNGSLHRQIHTKHRPRPGIAFDFDVPVMAFDDFFDDGQTQAGAVFCEGVLSVMTRDPAGKNEYLSRVSKSLQEINMIQSHFLIPNICIFFHSDVRLMPSASAVTMISQSCSFSFFRMKARSKAARASSKVCSCGFGFAAFG